jgi:ribose 5-phosphate isomerase A
LRRAQELRENAGCVVVLAAARAVRPGGGALAGSVPVLVGPAEEWEDIAEELDDIFLGDAELWRRPVSGTAGACAC